MYRCVETVFIMKLTVFMESLNSSFVFTYRYYLFSFQVVLVGRLVYITYIHNYIVDNNTNNFKRRALNIDGKFYEMQPSLL